jgi:GTP cyclohydrolase I
MEAALARQTLANTLGSEAEQVRQALVARGLETPLIPSTLTPAQKQARIKQSFEDIVTTLGLDLRDDSLAETPERIARMYVYEIF